MNRLRNVKKEVAAMATALTLGAGAGHVAEKHNRTQIVDARKRATVQEKEREQQKQDDYFDVNLHDRTQRLGGQLMTPEYRDLIEKNDETADKAEEIIELEQRFPDGQAVLEYTKQIIAEFNVALSGKKMDADKGGKNSGMYDNKMYDAQKELGRILYMHNWQTSPEASQIIEAFVEYTPSDLINNLNLVVEMPNMNEAFERAVFFEEKIVAERDVFLQKNLEAVNLNDPELARKKIELIIKQTLDKNIPLPNWAMKVLAKNLASSGLSADDFGDMFVSHPQLADLAKTLVQAETPAMSKKIEQAYKYMLKENRHKKD